MADYDYDKNSDVTISIGPNGEVTIDSQDTFREIAAEGDREGFYDFAEAHGSDYGSVGAGYHRNPQSWSGWASEAYTTVQTNFEFYPGNEVYNKVADGLIDEYNKHVSSSGRIPMI